MEQAPLEGELLGVIPGPDRPDYCAILLDRPLHLLPPPDLELARVEPGAIVRDGQRVSIRVNAIVGAHASWASRSARTLRISPSTLPRSSTTRRCVIRCWRSPSSTSSASGSSLIAERSTGGLRKPTTDLHAVLMAIVGLVQAH